MANHPNRYTSNHPTELRYAIGLAANPNNRLVAILLDDQGRPARLPEPGLSIAWPEADRRCKAADKRPTYRVVEPGYGLGYLHVYGVEVLDVAPHSLGEAMARLGGAPVHSTGPMGGAPGVTRAEGLAWLSAHPRA